MGVTMSANLLLSRRIDNQAIECLMVDQKSWKGGSQRRPLPSPLRRFPTARKQSAATAPPLLAQSWRNRFSRFCVKAPDS
jgi:hypothetical protein